MSGLFYEVIDCMIQDPFFSVFGRRRRKTYEFVIFVSRARYLVLN